MSTEILLIITFAAMIQSIFGAGILLFGTTMLLLLGYEFVNVLTIVLPISLTINLFQIAKDHRHIDFTLYRKVLVLTLPAIVLFLFLVTHYPINIGLVIGVFVLMIAIKEFSIAIEQFIDRIMQYETGYFVVMGVIHGLSNLGGTLLTALVHHKNYTKDVARVTIAVCYGTFAFVQILTLALFSGQQIDVAFSENTIYLVVGVLVYTLTDAMLYEHINHDKFRKYFSVFLALSGVALIVKSSL